MELVIAAARERKFPNRYIEALEHWLPAVPATAGTRKLGDIEWT
jgi:hypothetical protein